MQPDTALASGLASVLDIPFLEISLRQRAQDGYSLMPMTPAPKRPVTEVPDGLVILSHLLFP